MPAQQPPNSEQRPTNTQGTAPPPPPPGYYPPYYAEEEEINLLDYWRVMMKQKKTILAVTFATTLLAVIAAFVMTPVYRAEVLMAPVGEEQGKGGLSGLASQYSGLASLAGINLGGGGGTKEAAVATLKSRAFTEQFIKDEHLLPVLFAEKWNKKSAQWDVDDPEEIPTLRVATKLFNKEIRRVSEDTKTGLITLSIDWTDREEAARWANALVRRVNQRLRERAIAEAQKSVSYLKQELTKTSVVELQQAIYRLTEGQINKIMLANVREEYAFKVIDPATPPDKGDRIKPKRRLMLVLGFVVGGFLGILAAFFRNFLESQKATEEPG